MLHANLNHAHQAQNYISNDPHSKKMMTFNGIENAFCIMNPCRKTNFDVIESDVLYCAQLYHLKAAIEEKWWIGKILIRNM